MIARAAGTLAPPPGKLVGLCAAHLVALCYLLPLPSWILNSFAIFRHQPQRPDRPAAQLSLNYWWLACEQILCWRTCEGIALSFLIPVCHGRASDHHFRPRLLRKWVMFCPSGALTAPRFVRPHHARRLMPSDVLPAWPPLLAGSAPTNTIPVSC